MTEKANKIYFTIPGKPIVKARARFKYYGKTYDPQEKEKEAWQWETKQELIKQGVSKLIEGPLILKVSFIMPIPKSTPKKDLKELQDGKVMWHDIRPDLDNMIKWVKDCLNNLLYKDDSQVCYIAAMKVYGLEPETQIEIEKI